MNIQWARRQEERPALLFSTPLGQVFEPKQLCHRTAPTSDEHLVITEASTFISGKSFPRRRITSHCRKAVVPKPLEQPHILVYATRCRRPSFSNLSFFMFGKLVISHRKPGPDEENVTSPRLKLVRRHLLLPLKTRHQVVILNAMRASSVVLYARGLCVRPVVEQYSSAGDASCFMPRMNSQLPIRLVNDFVFSCAIVKELLLLVREMTQAIPLGAFLCVEGDLCTAVSHRDPSQFVFVRGLLCHRGHALDQ